MHILYEDPTQYINFLLTQVSLCSSDWSGIHYIYQVTLNSQRPFYLFLKYLGLKACIPTSSKNKS